MTLSTVVNRVMLVLVTIPVARILGKEDYGNYSLVAGTLMVFATFGASGFGALGNRYIAELKFKDPQRVSRIISLCIATVLVFGSITFFVMFFSAGWIATRLCDDPKIAPLFRLAAIGLYGIALNGLSKGVLGGFRAFSTQTVSQTFGVISAPILIGLGCYLYGLDGAVGGFAINHAAMGLFATLLAYRVMQRFDIGLDLAGFIKELPLLRTYWLPAMLGGAVVVPATWWLQVILKNQPDGELLLGACAAAIQFRLAMGIIPMAMGQVVFTLLSECDRDREPERFEELYDLSLRFTILIVLPITVVGIVSSKGLMAVFGESFVPDWQVMAIMSLSGFFIMLGSTVGQLMASSNRMWLSLTLNTFWMLLIVGLGYWLIEPYGAWGFAVANAVSYGIHLFVNYVVFRKVLHMHLLRAGLISVVSAVVIIAIAFAIAPLVSTMVGLFVGALLAAITATICWKVGLSASERKTLSESLMGKLGRLLKRRSHKVVKTN